MNLEYWNLFNELFNKTSATAKVRHDIFYVWILYAEHEGKKSRVNQVGGREL